MILRTLPRFVAAPGLALALAGCAALGLESAGPAAPGEEPRLAVGKLDRAVAMAEKRVARHPAAPAERARLGHVYLRAGRFASAVATFNDALTLGDRTPATVLGLSIGQAALGRNQAAVQLLDEWQDRLPAEDRGLALAMAGETGRGVEVLGQALRSGAGGVRLRQNLAYAYALDGRWREAALMAAQDLPPALVRVRIEQWARTGRHDAAAQRVAGLLAAPLRNDPGYPAALALAEPPDPAKLAAIETPLR